jgi:hypothetical protein
MRTVSGVLTLQCCTTKLYDSAAVWQCSITPSASLSAVSERSDAVTAELDSAAATTKVCVHQIVHCCALPTLPVLCVQGQMRTQVQHTTLVSSNTDQHAHSTYTVLVRWCRGAQDLRAGHYCRQLKFCKYMMLQC